VVAGTTSVPGAARARLLDLQGVRRRLVLLVVLVGMAAPLVACGGGTSGTADDLDDLEATIDPSTACTRRLDLTVFVDPAVPISRDADIGSALRDVPGVVEVSLVDQQQAYEDLKRLFPDTPGIDTLLPQNVPASFQVTLDDPAHASDVKVAATAIDGVGEVTLAQDAGVGTPTIPC
jgi:hypothetical protein